MGEYMFINLSLAYRDNPHQPKPSPGHPGTGPRAERRLWALAGMGSEA